MRNFTRLISLIFVSALLLSQSAFGQLSGTYTIGSSGTYATFTAAVSALQSQGVNGPVVFNVAAQTFTEQIQINAVSGANATNTISFVGAGVTSTTLTYSATSYSSRHTILLYGADYITFKDMLIRGTGSSYGWAMHLQNQANYNTFDNCKFDVGATSSSNRICIVASNSSTSYSSSGDNANYNTFKDCEIYGGYIGAYLRGSSSSTLCWGNSFYDCYFTNQYYYPLYTYYVGKMHIMNNIVRNVTSSSGYGMNLSYGSSDTVMYNDIQTQRYGAYFYYQNYYVSGNSMFSNNMIYNFNQSYHRGVYAYRAYNTKFYHNTIRINVTGSTSTSYCGMYLYYNQGCELKSNIIYDGGTYGYGIYQNYGSWADGSVDYNCYYNSGSSSYNIYWGTNYSSLSTWKSADPKNNQNSWDNNPLLTSTTDMHYTASSPVMFGPTGGVPEDIDGETRGNTFSTIGADKMEVNGLDITTVSIDAPTSWAIGNNTLAITLANLRKTVVTSLDLGYQLGSSTPVTVSGYTPSPSLNQGDGMSYTFSTPVNLPSGGAYTLKVWVAKPNNTSPDNNPNNDTITYSFNTPLQGTYTIGASGADFADFTEAVTTLNNDGISGPCIFNVAAGTYSEKISINQINGSSATNTIEFIGAGAPQTTITYAGSSTGNWTTITLDGADYVTFKNMRIQNTGTSYANCVLFTNNARYNMIDSCYVNVPTGTNSYLIPILASSSKTSSSGSGSNAWYNTISNNTVYGGYYGIHFYGGGSSSPNLGNNFINNLVTDQYYYPMYIYYNGEMHVTDNVIRNVSSTSGYGINLYFGTSDTVLRNDVQTGRYGFYFYYQNYYVNGNSLFANNAIYNFSNTSYNRGVYAYRTYNSKFYHNTIRTNVSSNSTSYCGIYLYYNTGCEIKNNIFHDGGNYGYSIYQNYGTWASGSVDYNCYYNQANNFVYWNGTIANLSAWQTAYPTLNANSWDINPGLTSTNDIHLTTQSLTLQAPYVGIDDDIEGQSRPNTTVFIGCDEPEPMVFDSFVVTDLSPQFAFTGQTRVKMMRIETKVSGLANPLPVTAAYFSTQGCSNPADLAKFRLYSQNGAPLDDAFEIMNMDSPNGVISVTPPSGTTIADIIEIYVAYDIEFGATINDSFDVSFDSVMIDGNMRYPKTGENNPPGSTFIVAPSSYADYCDVIRVNNGSYAIGTRRIKFEDIDLKTATLTAGFAPNNSAVQFNTTPVPTVFRNVTYPITIQHGELNAQSASVFIDYNNDAYFTANERVIDFLNLPEASLTNSYITIPCDITSGIHRMRITSDFGPYTPQACGSTNYGEVEDFLLYVAPEKTPVVTISNPDTGYVAGLVTFNADVDVDGDILVFWDYDNNSVVDDTSDIGEYYFNTAGTKTVAAWAELRGCVDTVTSATAYSNIAIVAATSVPVTNFIADNNIIIPATTVNFTDLSTNGPFSWKWEITPDTINGNPTYTFLGSDTDREPSVVFHEVGDYTIKLTTENTVGTSSETKVDYISVLKEEIFCVDASSRDETGYIYDNGGSGANYTNPTSGDSYTCSYLITPDCATSVTLDFLDFDVASNTISSCGTLPSDGIRIYDGLDTSGTPLHLQFLDGSGGKMFPDGFTNGPGNASIGLPPSVTATSGSMYVEFFVNCGAVGSGFEAKWTSQVSTPQKPIASISGQSTIYTNQTAYFESTSTGALDFFWDMDNDGWADLFTEEVSWQYTTPGTHPVTLIVYTCGKMDTAVFNLVVSNPLTKPVVDFYADYTNVTTVDPVTLTEDADNTVYAWQWEITPMTYTLLSGDLNATEVSAVFNATGSYTVKLVCTNQQGDDSLVKTNYIYVYKPCKPLVGNLNPDVGISQFLMQNIAGDTLIINTSSIGKDAYTDYSTVKAATIAKGGTYTFTLDRNTNFNKITRSIYIDFNQDGDFIDAGEEIGMQYNSTSLSWTIDVKIPGSIPTGLAKMRVAANAGQLYNKGCGPNFSGEFEDYGLEITNDITKPVITLIDSSYIVSNSCAAYAEPGYMATDAEEGDITSQVVVTGTINPTVAAVYEIKYNVMDAAGNAADEVIREVEVLADIVPPQAVKNGNNPDSFAVGGLYTDPGYTPTDNCSGVKTHSFTNNVNGLIVGWQQVMFIVEDNAGNIDTSYRDVYVYDDIDPTITLLGNNPEMLEAGDTFNDMGAMVNDNYYKNLTFEVIGTVNTMQLGTYFLSYCVTDSSGNGPVCVDRTVIVEDNTAPMVTIIGDNPFILPVYNNFKDPGVTITDNYYDYALGEIILTTNSTVNTYELGTYTVTYKAIDGSGNVSAIMTRTVEVVDQEAPMLELLGGSTVSVERWADYEDAGIRTWDNYYDEDDLTIHANDNGTYPDNTYEEGLYTYTYSVCDPSGNCSGDIFRTIYVVPSTSSITEVDLSDNISYYPNPADRILTVSVDFPAYKDVQVSVVNALGEEVIDVFEGFIKADQKTIDVSKLSSGMYYLRVFADNKQFNEKFVITH
ncbi:MAG: DUF5011 domain-containing protein [Bacteroidetes bacterium]|nr:DUF5011 domain-containing protein [Bacteroidota bacterium]